MTKTEQRQRLVELRNAALDRAGHICEQCGRGNRKLLLHHRTYETIGREALTDVEILCYGCHSREHHLNPHLRPPSYYYRGLSRTVPAPMNAQTEDKLRRAQARVQAAEAAEVAARQDRDRLIADLARARYRIVDIASVLSMTPKAVRAARDRSPGSPEPDDFVPPLHSKSDPITKQKGNRARQDHH